MAKKRVTKQTKQTVTLKEVRGGSSQEFDLQHALNLLRLQASTGRSGWVINDNNWEFKNNEISKKRSSNQSKETD